MMARLWGIATLLAATLAGCATAAPPTVAPEDTWRRDLVAYREMREKLAVDAKQLTEEFHALRGETSFPGLEDKIATLAMRVGRGEEPDDSQTLTRSLWSLSLGELLLFQRYLALSSRVLELEAAHAALESARLDLVLRRLQLRLSAGPDAEPGAGPVSTLADQPMPPPFSCPRYRVGRIEFVGCREPLLPSPL